MNWDSSNEYSETDEFDEMILQKIIDIKQSKGFDEDLVNTLLRLVAKVHQPFPNRKVSKKRKCIFCGGTGYMLPVRLKAI